MSKGVYVGVGGVARKCRKMYIGIGGVARKIKKAYIGVNGIARLFFSTGGNYVGTISSLSYARNSIASATVGNTAIFAGGHNSNRGRAEVDAFNSSLVRSTFDPLGNYKRGNMAGVSNSSYAIFAGGNNSYDDDAWSSIDAYTYNGGHLVNPSSVGGDMFNGGGVRLGNSNNVMIGGGYGDGRNLNIFNRIYRVFDINFAYITYTTNGAKITHFACANNSTYGVFAGGFNDSNGNYTPRNLVQCWDASIVRHTTTSLSTSRGKLSGAKIGEYMLFAGGSGESGKSSVVDVYDSNLVRSVLTLSSSRSGDAGISVDGYAFFGGGEQNVADTFDVSLTRETIYYSSGQINPAGASVGKYAITAGGLYPGHTGSSNIVNAFEF